MLYHQSALLVPLMLLAVLGASPASAFQQVHVAPFQKSARQSIPKILAAAPSGTAAVEESSSSTATITSSRRPNKTGPIQTLNSLPEFLDYLDNSPRNSLAVVEFYGKNCPLCKRVSLKYKKIAKTYSKLGVQFAEMEHPANKPVMDVLGIRKFPFLHVYRNGQCVAAHGTESSTAFEGIVKDTIQRELDMTEQDWEQFLTAFAGPIQKGTDKIDQLRTLMTQEEEVQQSSN